MVVSSCWLRIGFIIVIRSIWSTSFGSIERIAHVLCVDTGRSSETAKAHRG
eukprot:TRINITY_DN3917_c0_g1_i1.p2 TRINITY_DN3917_c0_g1~~TRINITY_DN3917_c0_g1_i1.p2  ORF type:complete len:51 (+),score=13.22 TRINITY_DN3917_c0_g1_i1:126-278(+)